MRPAPRRIALVWDADGPNVLEDPPDGSNPAEFPWEKRVRFQGQIHGWAEAHGLSHATLAAYARASEEWDRRYQPPRPTGTIGEHRAWYRAAVDLQAAFQRELGPSFHVESHIDVEEGLLALMSIEAPVYSVRVDSTGLRSADDGTRAVFGDLVEPGALSVDPALVDVARGIEAAWVQQLRGVLEPLWNALDDWNRSRPLAPPSWPRRPELERARSQLEAIERKWMRIEAEIVALLPLNVALDSLVFPGTWLQGRSERRVP